MQHQDWPRKRAYQDDNYASSFDRNNGPSNTMRANPGYPVSDQGRTQSKRGRGKPTSQIGGEAPFAPTTEHRIPVDVNSFPIDSNIIMQLLGPRGKHQQRMKSESDSIVTTSGKIMRGGVIPGEEPLSLVIRSKDPSVPLTQRQIAIVYQIYEDIIRHVKEYGLCAVCACIKEAVALPEIVVSVKDIQ